MLDIIRNQAGSWGIKVAFAVIIIVFVFGFGFGTMSGRQRNVMAEIGDEVISVDTFVESVQMNMRSLRDENPDVTEEELKQMNFKRNVFSELVTRRLIRNEAKRLGLTVSAGELFVEIAQNELFQGPDGKFNQAIYERVLLNNGLSVTEYERSMKDFLLREKLRRFVTLPVNITEDVAREYFHFYREKRSIEYLLFNGDKYKDQVGELSDEMLRSAYEQRKESFAPPEKIKIEYIKFTPESLADPGAITEKEVEDFYAKYGDRYFITEPQVNATHILMTTPPEMTPEEVEEARERAARLAERAREGEDFHELARKYSEGPSAANGGVLGWFGRQMMVKEFEDVAFSLDVGEISDPVKTQFGWHVIKVTDKRGGEVKPLDEVRDEIRKMIAEDRAEDHMANIMDDAVELVYSGMPIYEIADELGLELGKTPKMVLNQRDPGLGLKAAGMETLFGMETNSTTPSPLPIDDGYVLASPVEREESVVPPFEEAKEKVRELVIESESLKLAGKKAQEVLSKARSEALPEEYTGKLESIQPFTRDAQSVSGLGQVSGLITDAFTTPEGAWMPQTYPTPAGYVIAKVADVIEPDQEQWAQQKDVLVESIGEIRKTELFEAYLRDVQDKTEIAILQPELLEY